MPMLVGDRKESPMPDRRIIDRILAEEHLGIVGSSRNSKQFTNAVHRHLRAGGRTMHPVHREVTELEGDPAVATVADLPDEVRAVLVMVDADAAVEVVRECIASGITMVWLHRGAGNGAVSDEAVGACRAAGIDVVDGACPMMFAEPVGWFHRLHRVAARKRFSVASAA